MPVTHRIGVKGAELGVLRHGRALERAAVQVVPRVARDAGGVRDGSHGHLRRHVRVHIPAQLGIEIWPLQEGRQVLVITGGLWLLLAAGPLADQDEEQSHEEDAGDEDDNADDLLQADVPGRGQHLVLDSAVKLAVMTAETVRTVTHVRAVSVLAQTAVRTGVLHTLVHVTQTPGHTHTHTLT